jgi:hypothetical protein
MDLDDLLDQVHDRESFLEFVRALAYDRQDSVARERESPSSPYGPDAGGWENTTIEAYLDAAVSWAEDAAKSGRGLPEEPSWQAIARFLHCGKIYE